MYANVIMDVLLGLVMLILAGGAALLIFFILRQFNLWYFRINEMADNLAVIADYCRQQSRSQSRNGLSHSLPSATPEQNQRLRQGWD